jgi:hypothetical protein
MRNRLCTHHPAFSRDNNRKNAQTVEDNFAVGAIGMKFKMFKMGELARKVGRNMACFRIGVLPHPGKGVVPFIEFRVS